MPGKKILMLCGEFTEEYEIFVFQQGMEAVGHTVHVVTMGDGEPTERPCEVEVVSRHLPFPLRYGLVALRGARAARSADVVYASATYAAAAIASLLSRRPLVVKLVSDPAYERASRWRLFSGTLEEFQRAADRPAAHTELVRKHALARQLLAGIPLAGRNLLRKQVPHPQAGEALEKPLRTHGI